MAQQTKTPNKAGRTIALVLVVLAAALGVAVVWQLDTAPRTDDAYAYADTVSVAPEVSGRIVELGVRENQQVRQGEVLFRLDPRPYQATLDKTRASLGALDKEIALTQRSVNAQVLGAAASGANVEHARAAAEQASDTLARLEPLLDKGFVSAEQVNQARTAKRSAQSQLGVATLEAKRANAGISGVDALVARRAVIKAEITLAELNLEYTVVRAPFDGTVLSLKTTAGQLAAAGHPIFTLANTSRWYVVANFRESDLAHIKPGQSAQVYLLSDSSRRFTGAIESTGFGVFPDDGGTEAAGLPHVPRSINWVRVAQRFPVRIRVNKPDPALFRIGASSVAILAPLAAAH